MPLKILHVVPCSDEASGVCHVVRMLAKRQSAEGHDVSVATAQEFIFSTSTSRPNLNLHFIDEVWVHGLWLPREWRACLKVLKARKSARPRLVRMTHGSLSPVYLERQGRWKKRLVAPIERWLFARSDRVVVTGEWEADWCRRWGLKNRIETVDVRQFFDLTRPIVGPKPSAGRPLKVLYLGHVHPLKGVSCLERAVAELNCGRTVGGSGYETPGVELHVVSGTFGEALEREWQWADLLCLPTLSENFGLVVGEALERGKPVITTDGAPAWSFLAPHQGLYLKGYRAGCEKLRIRLLKDALKRFL